MAVEGRIEPPVEADQLRSFVEALPGPRSRLHSPEAMQFAEDMVLEAWRRSGWKTHRLPFSLSEAEGIKDHDDYRAMTYASLVGHNLLAELPGNQPWTVLVGAHLDTVRDSPGAMDNGAAVAMLVELARVVPSARQRPTVLLATFDMEEIGILGSPLLVAHLQERGRIDTAIILEALGVITRQPRSQMIPFGFGLVFPGVIAGIRARRSRGDWTALIYRSSAAPMARALKTYWNRSDGVRLLRLRDPRDYALIGSTLARLVPQLRQLARSDHASFWAAGIPAVLLTDTANMRTEHYHQPTDTADKIDFNHLARITEAVRAALLDETCVRRERVR